SDTYTLSLPDALPISTKGQRARLPRRGSPARAHRRPARLVTTAAVRRRARRLPRSPLRGQCRAHRQVQVVLLDRLRQRLVLDLRSEEHTSELQSLAYL